MSAQLYPFVAAPRGHKRHKIGAQVVRLSPAHTLAFRQRVISRAIADGLQDKMNRQREDAQKGVNKG